MGNKLLGFELWTWDCFLKVVRLGQGGWELTASREAEQEQDVPVRHIVT